METTLSKGDNTNISTGDLPLTGKSISGPLIAWIKSVVPETVKSLDPKSYACIRMFFQIDLHTMYKIYETNIANKSTPIGKTRESQENILDVTAPEQKNDKSKSYPDYDFKLGGPTSVQNFLNGCGMVFLELISDFESKVDIIFKNQLFHVLARIEKVIDFDNHMLNHFVLRSHEIYINYHPMFFRELNKLFKGLKETSYTSLDKDFDREFDSTEKVGKRILGFVRALLRELARKLRISWKRSQRKLVSFLNLNEIPVKEILMEFSGIKKISFKLNETTRDKISDYVQDLSSKLWTEHEKLFDFFKHQVRALAKRAALEMLDSYRIQLKEIISKLKAEAKIDYSNTPRYMKTFEK